jgi:hypothetical protein
VSKTGDYGYVFFPIWKILKNGSPPFATKLGTPVTDRVLTIPSRLGEGIIMARNVNQHFSYAVMNFKLTSDLEMHRESRNKRFYHLF